MKVLSLWYVHFCGYLCEMSTRPSLSRISMDQNKQPAFKSENWMPFLKFRVIGSKGYETNIDSDTVKDASVLVMGTYLPDLDLYHYTFDKYIQRNPKEIKQGLREKNHRKREIFWSLDKDKRVIDLIECEYLGLDKTQMLIKDTVCYLNTTIYQYDVSSLLVRYGGEYIRDWKNIRSAAIQQYKAFITEAVLP